MKKRDLVNKNTDFLKKKKQISDHKKIEAAALRNIINSYKTPQSFWKAISRVCEKLPKSPRKETVCD